MLIYDLHNADADFSAADIRHDDKGNVSFELLVKGRKAGHIRLSVNGLHNVSNALAAIAAASLLDVPMEKIQEGLLSFEGTDRRFQYKGDVNGFHIVDDYATIQRRSVPRWKPQSLTRIRRPGVSSSLTLTVERRHSSTSL